MAWLPSQFLLHIYSGKVISTRNKVLQHFPCQVKSLDGFIQIFQDKYCLSSTRVASTVATLLLCQGSANGRLIGSPSHAHLNVEHQ